MSDLQPEQEPASPDERPFFAPPPGYGDQPQPAYLPPQQQFGQYPSQQPPYGLQPAPYDQAWPPRRASHRTRYIILGVIGALVLVGAAAAVVSLLVFGKLTSAANGSTGALTGPPTASASSTAGSVSAYTWYTRDVNPTVTKLAGDYNRLRTDGNNNNDSAIRADCQQMLSDVHTAQSEPPVADPTLENDWTKVLGDFSAGASDCVGSVQNSDNSLADRARAEFLQGNTDAGKLVSDLEKLANGG